MSTPTAISLVSGGQTRWLDAPLPWPRLHYSAPLEIGCEALTYETIYRSQPNVRTVVSFLASNVAQVGLHVFQRRGETDRVRLRDHPLTRALDTPWPGVTQYRLMEALVSDVAIYGQAFWIKVSGGSQAMRLFRVPPVSLIRVDYDDTTGEATEYTFATARGEQLVLPASQIVHFVNYSPLGREGVSTLEALRLMLGEDIEAANYRAQLWRNGARVGGVIKRPADAPEWNDATRERFRAEWQAWYTGANGSDAGGTPVLEDGMDFVVATGYSAEQAQYLEARKLSMVQVAAAYHVPPPMVGVLDNANFSNVREFHRSLYQDTLGPWFRMIEQQINSQVLPDLNPNRGVYVEFNVAEKLRGSFEEQARALTAAVGAPYMTRSEARARMNLPEREDADGLVVPLNTTVTTTQGEDVPEPVTESPGEPAVVTDAASRSNGHEPARI